MRLGDIPIQIEARECVLRPNVSALMAIEKATGKTMLELYYESFNPDKDNNIDTRGYRMSFITAFVVLKECLKAGGNPVPDVIIEQVIEEHGILSAYLMQIFLQVFMAALSGPKSLAEFQEKQAIQAKLLGENSLEQPSESSVSPHETFTT